MSDENWISSLKPIIGSILWSHLLALQTPPVVLDCIVKHKTDDPLYLAIQHVAALPDAWEAQRLLKTGGKVPDVAPEERQARAADAFWEGVSLIESDFSSACAWMSCSGSLGCFRSLDWFFKRYSGQMTSETRLIFSALYSASSVRKYEDVVVTARLGCPRSIITLACRADCKAGPIAVEKTFWFFLHHLINLPGRSPGLCIKRTPWCFYAVGQWIEELHSAAEFSRRTTAYLNDVFCTQGIQEEPVEFYLRMRKEIRAALDTVSLVLNQCGVVQDVRLIICRMLWAERHFWIK